jgi:hypothetical protein
MYNLVLYMQAQQPMSKVVLKPKITEGGIRLNVLHSSLGSIELASVSAQELNGMVQVSIVPSRVVCFLCKEEIDGARPSTICFAITGKEALGPSTTLL